MKKIILLFILIFSIQNSYSYISSCNFYGLSTEEKEQNYGLKDGEYTFGDCSYSEEGKDYFISINNNINSCKEVRKLGSGKIIKSFCDFGYFNGKYPDGLFEEDDLFYNWYKNTHITFLPLGKYNYYPFFFIAPSGYDDEHKEIIGKTEDFLGFYIGDKRIYSYNRFNSKKENLNQKYGGLGDIFSNAYKVPDDNKRGYQYIKAPVLSKKSQERLNKFIAKFPKDKYGKVFQKIEKIRKDYTNMELYRHRFIKEVLDYIYFEMKVIELTEAEGVSGYMKYHPSW